MIPKIIHQIWFQGFNNLPEKYIDNVKSIRELNPDWQYIQWDDSTIKLLLYTLGQAYVDKYNSFEHIHQKIDFGRYAILYTYGGVSVDVDVVAYKNFNETPYINEKDFIVSYNSSNAFENYIKSGRTLIINNATILVNKNNEILKGLLDHILTLTCDINESKYKCINETTGVKEFTNFLDQYKDQIIVLENSYLEPCSGSDNYCEIKPNSIVDHQHAGTWVGDTNKNIAQSWYWAKGHKTELITVFIIIVILIFIIVKF